MNDRVRLLNDLDQIQALTLQALGDLAEERGEHAWAAGWRWLAVERRWPVLVHDANETEPSWQWWREKEERSYGCSLPRLLMEHVRRHSSTPDGKSCRFDRPGAALACAAFCAGNLITLFGSIE